MNATPSCDNGTLAAGTVVVAGAAAFLGTSHPVLGLATFIAGASAFWLANDEWSYAGDLTRAYKEKVGLQAPPAPVDARNRIAWTRPR